jgi:hypothetical protein
LQLFRHKPGQLDSLKDLDLDELESLRIQQAQKIKELEERYYQTKGADNLG